VESGAGTRGPTPPSVPLPPPGTAECGSCYGAHEDAAACCNSCAEVREAYKTKHWSLPDPQTIKQCHDETHHEALLDQVAEGCHVWGELAVGRVAGNFHIAPGKSWNAGGSHIHDLSPFHTGELDVAHTVHSLSFGTSFPGQANPLDGAHKGTDETRVPADGAPPGEAAKSAPAQSQYFLKVVPTTHVAAKTHVKARDGAGLATAAGDAATWSASYSVAEHTRAPAGDGADPPGVFFFYDLSPIRVETVTARPPLGAFAAATAAVVGGVWSLAGAVEAALHGAGAKRKRDLGKLT